MTTAEEKFDAVYQQYQLYVRAICRRSIGNSSISAETEQDIWLRIFQHLDDPDPTKLQAWICAVASNECRDRIAAEKLRTSCVMSLELMDSKGRPFEPRQPDFSEITDPRIVELRVAINQLPETQRRVVLMSYFAEMTAEEIGMEIGQSTGAVTKALTRARLRLAELMGHNKN